MSLIEAFESPRKRRGKKKSTPDDNTVITLPDDPDPHSDTVTINPDTGTVEVTNDDGSVTIDPTGEILKDEIDIANVEFSDNLADLVDLVERGRIAEDLLTAIQSDKQDRQQWESMRAKAVELLGMKLDEPKSDVSTSALGMSTSVVRDPVLLYNVEKFRANAYAELCPAGGPVKTQNYADETAAADDDATALQKDLNFYFTQTASEYYPDTRYMLWWTGLASGTFKKVYYHPIKRRPYSEYVDGTNLIVPSNATDLKNATRITHQSTMPVHVLKRMQYEGVYRKIDLTVPLPPTINAVEQKIANIEGKAPSPQRIEDQDYTIFEVYCYLDLKGFEDTDPETDEITGLPLPYRVTIEDTSKEILEIRRNWAEDDEDKIAKIPFVLFPYSTGVSRIYGSGMGQMLGNLAMALTALLRISIDGGMAANYPGLLKAKGTGRQLQNEIRVPPGGCAEIDTGGLPIQQAVMGMPYKDVSGMVISLMEQIRALANQVGGAAEIPVGEGKADIPVGTILAMIEQATKIEGAVHKALHDAQKEEFQLFMDLFQQDPESLWRGNRRPALGADKEARVARFKQALENWRIVPVSDPNVPSETHRILKAYALLQIGQNNPLFNQPELMKRIGRTLKVDDFDQLLNPPNPNAPPPSPEQMALLSKVQTDKQNADTKQMQVLLQAKNQAADRQSKQDIEAAKMAHQHVNGNMPAPVDPFAAASLALDQTKVHQASVKMALDARNAEADRQADQNIKAMDIAARVATHPEAQPAVNAELMGLSPFLTPSPGSNTGLAKGGKVQDVKDQPSIDAILNEIDEYVKRGARLQ